MMQQSHGIGPTHGVSIHHHQFITQLSNAAATKHGKLTWDDEAESAGTHPAPTASQPENSFLLGLCGGSWRGSWEALECVCGQKLRVDCGQFHAAAHSFLALLSVGWSSSEVGRREEWRLARWSAEVSMAWLLMLIE
jgi:hypothetical protein